MQGTHIRRITIWLAAAVASLVVGASAAMAYPADPGGDVSTPDQLAAYGHAWYAQYVQKQKELRQNKKKHRHKH